MIDAFKTNSFKLCLSQTVIGLMIAVGGFAGTNLYLAQTITSVKFPGADGVVLEAALYVPKGAGPFPAVVALHGCAGLRDANGDLSLRHKDWAERLSLQGFIVLFPDSFASRGLGPQCKNSEREVHPARERVADVKAALDYLVASSQVKANAISLLGWSNGGSSVLYSVMPKNAPERGDFARAIAFYPGCRVPFEKGRWASRIPLLILIGEADDWTPAAPCKALAEDSSAHGEQVQIKTYADAYHDFDHPDLPVHVVDHLAFTASGNGSAHTGTNAVARADAIGQVIHFLAR